MAPLDPPAVDSIESADENEAKDQEQAPPPEETTVPPPPPEETTVPPAVETAPPPPSPAAPTVPTSQEQAPHGYKTRFRPTFDPNVGIFKVSKRLQCEGGVYLVGDYVYPNDENIDGRRLRQLFSQRYLDYPTNEEIDRLWNDPKGREQAKKKAAQNQVDELTAQAKVEADLKAKAAAQAKQSNANRAGNINRVHDQNG